jgi:transcriptional regulator GlxA family with amidase domain
MMNFKSASQFTSGLNEKDAPFYNALNRTHTKIIEPSRLKIKRTQLLKMEGTNFNNKTAEEWLTELENQIIQNISKMNFTIDDLAIYMNVSKRQLYRLINERVGETPHAYLKNYRLNYAKMLLENKQVRSVKAAAYSTGFPNAVYFSRQFKASFGYLPSDLL